MKELVVFIGLEILVCGLAWFLLSLAVTLDGSKEPFQVVGETFAAGIGIILVITAVALAVTFFDEEVAG